MMDKKDKLKEKLKEAAKEFLEVDENSDIPVHEKYVKDEKIRK